MAGRVRRLAVAVAGVVGLAALASAEPAAMLPLAPGTTWKYSASKKNTISAGSESSESNRTADIEETVTDPSPLSTSREPVTIVRRRTDERGANSVMSTVTETYLHLSSTPSGIWLHRVDQGKRPSEPFVRPRPLFSDPPPKQTTPLDNGAMRGALEITQQTREKISVPAGDYADAYKVVAEGAVSGKLGTMPIKSGTAKITSWFVRGVGLVREDRVLDMKVVAPNGDEGRNLEESTKVLQAYLPPSSAPTNKTSRPSEPSEIPLPILR